MSFYIYINELAFSFGSCNMMQEQKNTNKTLLVLIKMNHIIILLLTHFRLVLLLLDIN